MKNPRDWQRYRSIAIFDPEAAERGRVLTAHKIASEPETRQRVEEAFGVEFCKQQYPEAYRSGFAKLLDRVRAKIPW